MGDHQRPIQTITRDQHITRDLLDPPDHTRDYQTKTNHLVMTDHHIARQTIKQ